MITYHCNDCGEQVTESCANHPRAAINSVKNPDIRIIVLADGETWERLGSGDACVVSLTDEEYKRILNDEKPRDVVNLDVRGEKVE